MRHAEGAVSGLPPASACSPAPSPGSAGSRYRLPTFARLLMPRQNSSCFCPFPCSMLARDLSRSLRKRGERDRRIPSRSSSSVGATITATARCCGSPPRGRSSQPPGGKRSAWPSPQQGMLLSSPILPSADIEPVPILQTDGQYPHLSRIGVDLVEHAEAVLRAAPEFPGGSKRSGYMLQWLAVAAPMVGGGRQPLFDGLPQKPVVPRLDCLDVIVHFGRID